MEIIIQGRKSSDFFFYLDLKSIPCASAKVINIERSTDDLSIFHTGLWLIFFLGYKNEAIYNGKSGGEWNVLCAYFMSC